MTENINNYVRPVSVSIYNVDEVTDTNNVPGVVTSNNNFNKTISYFNLSDIPVDIVHRDGMIVRVKNTPNRSKSLVIRVKYEIPDNCTIDPLENMANRLPDGWRVVIDQIDAIPDYSKKLNVIKYNIVIPVDDIKQSYGSAIYAADLDVVISTLGDAHAVPEHPYSSSAIRNRLITTDINLNDVDKTGMYLMLVDNKRVLNDHYLNLNGDILTVRPVVNNTLQDGVYICGTSPLNKTGVYSEPTTKHISYTEALEKLRLYNNYDDAVSGGDYFKDLEKQLKMEQVRVANEELRLKNEGVKLKTEYEDKKRAVELSLAEHKRQIELEAMSRQSELSTVEHHYKSKSMVDKDYYENRSYRRKDSSEFIKMLPVLITGGLAIGTIAWNLGNRSK